MPDNLNDIPVGQFAPKASLVLDQHGRRIVGALKGPRLEFDRARCRPLAVPEEVRRGEFLGGPEFDQDVPPGRQFDVGSADGGIASVDAIDALIEAPDAPYFLAGDVFGGDEVKGGLAGALEGAPGSCGCDVDSLFGD